MPDTKGDAHQNRHEEGVERAVRFPADGEKEGVEEGNQHKGQEQLGECQGSAFYFRYCHFRPRFQDDVDRYSWSIVLFTGQ